MEIQTSLNGIFRDGHLAAHIQTVVAGLQLSQFSSICRLSGEPVKPTLQTHHCWQFGDDRWLTRTSAYGSMGRRYQQRSRDSTGRLSMDNTPSSSSRRIWLKAASVAFAVTPLPVIALGGDKVAKTIRLPRSSTLGGNVRHVPVLYRAWRHVVRQRYDGLGRHDARGVMPTGRGQHQSDRLLSALSTFTKEIDCLTQSSRRAIMYGRLSCAAAARPVLVDGTVVWLVPNECSHFEFWFDLQRR